MLHWQVESANPFPPTTLKSSSHSNRDLARDFLDLSFSLESSSFLKNFTKFEGPISVRFTGEFSATLYSDLNRLLHRLKEEADLDIFVTASDDANITIMLASSRQIQRIVPSAAYFVAPNVTSLKEFRATCGTLVTSWSRQKIKTKVGIFLPNDVGPQAVRDYLHEEFAQALGPLNVLYRLQYSVFNDDNVHTVLTPFDTLMLRITYAPEFRNGMSRSKVSKKLAAILSQLDPQGNAIEPRYIKQTDHLWKKEILKISSFNTSDKEK